jgi:hypothetical protein
MYEVPYQVMYEYQLQYEPSSYRQSDSDIIELPTMRRERLEESASTAILKKLRMFVLA